MPCNEEVNAHVTFYSDTKSRSLPAPDDVLQETDVRYWMLSTEEVHNVEKFPR